MILNFQLLILLNISVTFIIFKNGSSIIYFISNVTSNKFLVNYFKS